jgi:signal peptidase I
LKSGRENPDVFSRKGQDLFITGEILKDLMRDVLAKGADFKFRAKGFSMTPFIKNGDIVTITPLAKESPSIGKVVAYTRSDSGQLVVHRVIGRQGSEYLIQGDNTTDHEDELIPSENMLGCVTLIERDSHRIYLGLGPERYLIAAMSRNGLLYRVIEWLRVLKGKIIQ